MPLFPFGWPVIPLNGCRRNMCSIKVHAYLLHKEEGLKFSESMEYKKLMKEIEKIKFHNTSLITLVGLLNVGIFL